jgi:hypothetical protein
MRTKLKHTAVASILAAAMLGIGVAEAHKMIPDLPGREVRARERNERFEPPQQAPGGAGAHTERFFGDEPVAGDGALETYGFVWSRARR